MQVSERASCVEARRNKKKRPWCSPQALKPQAHQRPRPISAADHEVAALGKGVRERKSRQYLYQERQARRDTSRDIYAEPRRTATWAGKRKEDKI